MIRLVSFDCWNTLLIPADPVRATEQRARAIQELTGLPLPEGEQLLVEAWQRHLEAWRAVRAYGPREMAAWMVEQLGLGADAEPQLEAAFSEATAEVGVEPVKGAEEVLSQLRAKGLRLVLICDVAITSGRTIRSLLGSAGLFGYLDEAVFSDEVGVPKPDPRIFEEALGRLNMAGSEGLHVGDLRSTDVAGARQVGMTTVRFRGVQDDDSEGAEADFVIDDLRELVRLLDQVGNGSSGVTRASPGR